MNRGEESDSKIGGSPIHSGTFRELKGHGRETAGSRPLRFLLSLATCALLVSVFLITLTDLAAAQTGNGSVTGTVVNDTARGATVASADVTLTAYKDQGQTTAGTQTAKTDKDGRFAFAGLDTSSTLTYQASIDFQGAPYYSETFTFAAGSSTRSVQVDVADSTTSSDSVKSTSTHFLVSATRSGIDVSEIIILSNAGDKTYIGSKEIHPGTSEVLRLTVPPGAQNVEMLDGFAPAQAFPVEGGISDTYPLYPGDSQRIFQYQIPVTGTSGSFTTKIDLPTDQVNVLLTDNGVQADVSNLPDRSSREIQGQKYLVFSGKSLAVGTSLEFKLDSLPVSQAPAAASSSAAPKSVGASPLGTMPLAAGGVLLVLLAALSGIAVTLRRRRTHISEGRGIGLPGESPSEGAEFDDLDAERAVLVAAIAGLDDRYEQGNIGSEEYGKVREQKKRRLIEVAVRQREIARNRGEQ